MMMVGFSWIFIGLAAGFLAPLVVPGRRDAQLPVAMLVACTGAFMGALFSSIVFNSPDRTGKPDVVPEWTGLIMSIVGGAVAFGFYVATMRRPAQPRGA
ncbi:MAG TPA: hypothetical protein VKE40_14540 [Gemmataceae bacterium]|nr:hypothetical protein [Gemmataceae bacterium]